MTVTGGFTQTIEWLAFTLPKAGVDEVVTMIGGDWFQSAIGFRGYPVAQLMTQGKTFHFHDLRHTFPLRRSSCRAEWISTRCNS